MPYPSFTIKQYYQSVKLFLLCMFPSYFQPPCRLWPFKGEKPQRMKQTKWANRPFQLAVVGYDFTY